MTIALIVVNVLIYMGWQETEARAIQQAARQYAQSALPAMELPHFSQYLQKRAQQNPSEGNRERAKLVDEMLQEVPKAEATQDEDMKAMVYETLYAFMLDEGQFYKSLRAGEVIRPSSEQYAQWQSARRAFSRYEPKPFTKRWAQDYSLYSVADVLARPVTLLTSTFLHGSFGHLLGNMVFLFIFGFTLEKALGAWLYLGCYLVAGVGASAVAAWAYAGNEGYGLGASGAVAGLMAMYVMLYRLRRIKFFYYFLFYFGYVSLPALVMLPVWMGYEWLQSQISDEHVAYMAHLGGLFCGALLMALLGLLRPLAPPIATDADALGEDDGAADAACNAARARPPALPAERKRAEAAAHIRRAQECADALDFAASSQSWRAAAKLCPADADVLESWFAVARHLPNSNDLHIAAQMVFQLPAHDEETCLLQQRVYRDYLDLAQPVVRLRPEHMVQLAHTFLALDDLDEAERMCRLLEKSTHSPAVLPALIGRLVYAWIRQGQPHKARAWFGTLQRLAPTDPVTLWLAQQV